MRIDAPIFTGSFSLNGNTLQDLGSVSTTGSNAFVGNQTIQGFVSASAFTGSINYTNLTSVPTLVSGGAQIIDILTSINSATASFSPRISNLESKSASVDISVSNINSITASNIARLTNLESKSASVDISITNINSFTSSNANTSLNTFSASNGNTSLNSLTGSYATTGSNTFFGTQTYSGSVYIANDLVVQGSSSIQYISASSVSIGTNIVQLNTANPSIRFAGLTMIDSGSIGGSGSFLYDSLQDEFVFVHRGNGSNITSSHFVLGPETYDSLGNELYLTCNVITKGTGKEHLVDSCIFDNGTTTCIKNNLVGTGTACFAGQICAPSLLITDSVKFGTITAGTPAQFSFNSTTGTQTTANITDSGNRCGILEIIAQGGEAGQGSGIILGADTWGGGNGRGQVAIKALLTDGSGCGVSDLAFSLRNNSACSNLTERMRITSSGNVGINTTNFGERLNIGCGSAIAWQNTCNCQKWHIQHNSADGLNFVESSVADFRLFLKAGGNVGVGLSTPTAQLHICSAYSQTPLVVQGGGNGNVPIACFYSGVNQLALLDDNGNLIIGSTSFSTRGTVTSNGLMVSGRVGIGTACPVFALDVSSATGAVISATTRTNDGCCSEIRAGWTSPNGGVMRMGYYPSTAVGYIDNTYTVASGQPYGDIQFRQIVSGTHCIRLIIKGDGGNVGIGTSSPSERLHIYGTGSGPELRMEGTWGSHYIRAYNDNWNFLTNGGRIAIAMNNLGSVFNYQNTTTWQQTSDIRIKENINEISNSLNLIKALKPVSFDYKQEFAEKNNWDDTMKLNNVGFIAQEFETVFPKYVSMNNYTLGDTLIEDFKSIDTGHLVPYIIKAMQEQQCTIDTLKSCLGIN